MSLVYGIIDEEGWLRAQLLLHADIDIYRAGLIHYGVDPASYQVIHLDSGTIISRLDQFNPIPTEPT